MAYGDDWKSDYELRRERERMDSRWHDSNVMRRWAAEDRVREIDYELHKRADRRREEEEAEARHRRQLREQRERERLQEEEYWAERREQELMEREQEEQFPEPEPPTEQAESHD